jgi:exopolysaccharide production protein ExoQ
LIGTEVVFGFERLPVFPFAVLMIFCLCVPAVGVAALLLQLAAFGAVLAICWRRLPAILFMALPFALLPIFAVLSALWSDVPMISLRYGVQLLITVLMGVVLARVLDLRQLVLAVFIGVSLACLLGLASGRTGASESGAVLIGLAGSKNQFSYFALFWIGSALCVLASARHRPFTRIAAALMLLPAAFVLWQGNSMTAIVSAALMAAMLALLALAHWLGRGGRMFALAAAGLLAAPVLVGLPQIEAEATRFRSDVLGKDSRLTGRTLLWEAADSLIRQQPVIGHGYKAIWLGHQGKGLLARNDQDDGRAFHFHDTFRELQADLGLIGLLLFLVPVGFVFLRSIVLLIARVDAPRAFAVVTLLTILLRVRTELVIGPFLTETVVLYAVLAALLALPLGSSERDPERTHVPRPRTSPRTRSRPERKPA